jgi:hypothetical protein
MSNTPVQPGDLQSLWQSMPATPVAVTVEDMRARAVAFERKVGRRNAIEYVASAMVIAIFGWYATWPEPATPLWPLANIAIIIGTLVMVWNLHRLSAAAGLPRDASLATLIDYHRAGLVQQRDALRSVWRWYLLPFAPGLALWFTAVWIGTPDTERKLTFGLGLALAAVVSLAVSGFIVLLNLIGAARLQRMIEDLDRFGEN